MEIVLLICIGAIVGGCLGVIVSGERYDSTQRCVIFVLSGICGSAVSFLILMTVVEYGPAETVKEEKAIYLTDSGTYVEEDENGKLTIHSVESGLDKDNTSIYKLESSSYSQDTLVVLYAQSKYEWLRPLMGNPYYKYEFYLSDESLQKLIQ